MTTPAASQQPTRDVKFLRWLATDPGDALNSWKSLNEVERLLVVTFMTLYYGDEFVKRFRRAANKPHHPHHSPVITFVPGPSPARMKARGFRLRPHVGFSSNTQEWVAPDGREVWVLPYPKGVPPKADPPADTSFDFEELRRSEAVFDQRFHQLADRGRQAKRQGTLGPEWINEYVSVLDQLNDVLAHRIPGVASKVPPGRQAAADQLIARLQGFLTSMEDLLEEVAPGTTLPPRGQP
jgi:hypothetical protein